MRFALKDKSDGVFRVLRVCQSLRVRWLQPLACRRRKATEQLCLVEQ
jgi:hypothetical protein